MYNSRYKGDDLLQQIAEGNQAAFAELFHAHHQRLGVVVFGWTRSMALTEEIVQDVFMKVWDKREELPVIGKIEGYLYIMARNRAYNCLRQAARERLRHREWMLETVAEPAAAAENDYAPLIEQAVANLPTQQKKVYLLKHHHRLAYDEISRLMQISPETARKHLAAALRSITSYVRAHLHILLLILSRFL